MGSGDAGGPDPDDDPASGLDGVTVSLKRFATLFPDDPGDPAGDEAGGHAGED